MEETKSKAKKANKKAEMKVMAADVNEAPKGEDPSGPRGCDCKEDKEPAPMTIEWGVVGGVIISSYVAVQLKNHNGDPKEGKKEEDEEALLEMSNWVAAMEGAVAKAIAEHKERPRIGKETLERRVEDEWR